MKHDKSHTVRKNSFTVSLQNTLKVILPLLFIFHS